MADRFRPDHIAEALAQAWSIETSSQWRADNPAQGQCNVTALVVTELFGGAILKTALPEGDHFYNLIGGRRYDFTASQFDVPIAYADVPSDRADALGGTTPGKCETFKSAFRRALEASSTETDE